jgi:hypothetical protein
MSKMWSPQSNEILIHWLQTIRDEAEEKLTSWELNFIDSIEGKLAFGGQLSEKQENILERIYAEKTK